MPVIKNQKVIPFCDFSSVEDVNSAQLELLFEPNREAIKSFLECLSSSVLWDIVSNQFSPEIVENYLEMTETDQIEFIVDYLQDNDNLIKFRDLYFSLMAPSLKRKTPTNDDEINKLSLPKMGTILIVLSPTILQNFLLELFDIDDRLFGELNLISNFNEKMDYTWELMKDDQLYYFQRFRVLVKKFQLQKEKPEQKIKPNILKSAPFHFTPPVPIPINPIVNDTVSKPSLWELNDLLSPFNQDQIVNFLFKLLGPLKISLFHQSKHLPRLNIIQEIHRHLKDYTHYTAVFRDFINSKPKSINLHK